jgi:hypothetical protein
MNRPALEALRDQADVMMRRAETAGAPVRMATLRTLLDAVLAPDAARVAVDVRPGEILRGPDDAACERARADMWHRMAVDQHVAGLANWSA